MKNHQFIFATFCLLQMMGCRTDGQRTFLAGTFVNSSKGEFSKADDTLSIEPAEGNTFLIHRRTGFNLLKDGKVGARQYEREEWTAIYDEGTRSLSEVRKGKLITIHPDSGYLLVGKRKYTKKQH